MTSWSIQDAKNKLSELVDTATTGDPQLITKHGKPVAVVMSAERYDQLAPKETLADILRDCPVKDWEVDRPDDSARDLILE
jgi:antitoxin Phd